MGAHFVLFISLFLSVSVVRCETYIQTKLGLSAKFPSTEVWKIFAEKYIYIQTQYLTPLLLIAQL